MNNDLLKLIDNKKKIKVKIAETYLDLHYLRQEYQELDEIIEKVCDHEWKHDTCIFDPHKIPYKCSKCGSYKNI